ncbi:MAG: hypothetical protein V2I48_11610 [Xanthomonadales bacterium]|jgi:hypothetical protein|nr:hypothetical protein [Xanthomonadales bacterium]
MKRPSKHGVLPNGLPDPVHFEPDHRADVISQIWDWIQEHDDIPKEVLPLIQRLYTEAMLGTDYERKARAIYEERAASGSKSWEQELFWSVAWFLDLNDLTEDFDPTRHELPRGIWPWVAEKMQLNGHEVHPDQIRRYFENDGVRRSDRWMRVQDNLAFLLTFKNRGKKTTV